MEWEKGTSSSMDKHYGLLCKAVATSTSQGLPAMTSADHLAQGPIEPRLFLNVLTPWPALIYGSLGLGKSHTLSYMPENCLISSRSGELPARLAAIVWQSPTLRSCLSLFCWGAGQSPSFYDKCLADERSLRKPYALVTL